MKMYDPFAYDINGEKHYTYDHCTTMSKALTAFETWENDFYRYRLSIMWIEVRDTEDDSYFKKIPVKRKYVADLGDSKGELFNEVHSDLIDKRKGSEEFFPGYRFNKCNINGELIMAEAGEYNKLEEN